MNKTQWGIAALVVGAGIVGLVVQRRSETRLKEQIAVLSRENEEVRRLREENKRLAETPRPAAPGREQAAAPVEPPAAPKPDESRPVASKSPLAPGLAPIDTLDHAGRATARAALSTQLWAAAHGDVDLEATAITFGPEARAKLEAVLATLPEPTRTDYGTPERLMASVLAGSPHPVGGMQVLGESAQGPDTVTVQMNWQHADDTVVHHSDVQLQRDDNGWRMVVPMVLVDRAVAYVTRNAGPAVPPKR